MEDQSKETPAPVPEIEDPRLQAQPQAEGTPLAVAQSREPGDGKEKQKRWSADPALVEAITALGFSKNCAEKALFYTGSQGADQAVGWILDNPEAAEDPRSLDLEGFSSASDDSDVDNSAELQEMLSGVASSYKMVFVVNGALKMGAGKVAAQVGHATLGLYRRLLDLGEAGQAALSAWDCVGEAKVVLKASDDQQLMRLEERCRTDGLPHYLVQDAGRTQIPSGSVTVLSIFGAADKLEPFTKELKLL